MWRAFGDGVRQSEIDSQSHQMLLGAVMKVSLEAATFGVLGLDEPLYRQYFDYVSDLARGDLGQSIVTKQFIVERMGQTIPLTTLFQEATVEHLAHALDSLIRQHLPCL